MATKTVTCTACGDVATYDIALTKRSNDTMAFSAGLCAVCYRTVVDLLSAVQRRSGLTTV